MYINNIKDGVTAILVKDETDTNLLGFAHKSLYVKPKSGGGGGVPAIHKAASWYYHHYVMTLPYLVVFSVVTCPHGTKAWVSGLSSIKNPLSRPKSNLQ